jgi:hypothetical protein
VNYRNTKTYTAIFKNLKLEAFGIDQVIDYECLVEIYQARANPELWRARPTFSRNLHKWEARSAEDLQELIASDFEVKLRPWFEHHNPHTGMSKRPSLTAYTGAQIKRVG